MFACERMRDWVPVCLCNFEASLSVSSLVANVMHMELVSKCPSIQTHGQVYLSERLPLFKKNKQSSFAQSLNFKGSYKEQNMQKHFSLHLLPVKAL